MRLSKQRTPSRRRLALALLIGAAAASLSAPPAALASPAVTFITTTGNAFTPATVTMVQGEHVEYVNESLQPLTPHNVASDDFAPDGRRLFGTPQQVKLIWGTAPVFDAEKLAPGSYGFHCTIHTWMTGTLVVVPPEVS
jgi:plastocyanin